MRSIIRDILRGRPGRALFLTLTLSASGFVAAAPPGYTNLVELFGEFVEWRSEASSSNLALGSNQYRKTAVRAQLKQLKEMRHRFDALEAESRSETDQDSASNASNRWRISFSCLSCARTAVLRYWLLPSARFELDASERHSTNSPNSSTRLV